MTQSRSRSLTVAAVICLLLAGCADDPETATPSDPTTATTGDQPRDATDQPPQGSTTTGRPSSGGGTTSSATRSTAPSPPPPPAAPPSATSAGGPPGTFARTLLRPAPATRLVLEQMQQSGAAPRQATIDHAARVLGQVSAKQVDRPAPIALSGGARTWTASEVRALADSQGRAQQGGDQAVLRVLFLRGSFSGGGDDEGEVLGVAVRGDVAALFPDAISRAETPLIDSGEIEDAVLMHELGHLLGLVDLAIDTGRDDPEHPSHSRNRNSVMYWAVESSLISQVLSGGPPRDFDRDDLADLSALRNGA